MNMFEQMPFSEKYPVFRKLAEIGDLRKLSREELELYDEDIKNMRDIYATRKFDEKTRALSYVTGSDWKDLEKVSPLSIEKYKQELQTLNAQVAEAIADPNVAYMVYSTGSKTFVRKVKENVDFDFDISEYAALGTRAPLPTLSINGGSQSTTGSFKDASRTINMEVRLNASIQFNYYFFEVLSPNAKPDYDDNITTPESVAFSGTGPLSNTRFVWTAYWDAQDKNDKMFKWEFKGKGTTPSFGFIADCTFSK